MPVPTVPAGRDLIATSRTLSAWFAARLPDVDEAEVVELRRPTGGGGSSDTFLTKLHIRRGQSHASEEYVIRIKPTHHRLFLRQDFDVQYRLLKYLHAHTDVPTPAIHLYETDETILGAPFWLMEKVEGLVPPDVPCYNVGGFLLDATPAERRKLWLSGMQALAAVHRLDTRDLPPIVALEPGQSGLDENLRHWGESMMWANDDRPTLLMRKTLDWLWANKPGREVTALSWGDARIGNMMFRDFKCVAVLDWETITLAGPLLDLAHWLFMDCAWSEDVGLVRLPGLGTRDETIRTWEDLTGQRADHFQWYEVLAAFRLSIIGMRSMRITAGVQLDPNQFDQLYSRRLARVFAEASAHAAPRKGGSDKI